MKRVLVPLAVVALVAACDHDPQPLTPPDQPLAAIFDGDNGGNPEFFFLPPLVKQPTLPNNFDPMAYPTVEICPLMSGEPQCGESVVARFTRFDVIDQSATHFHVDWDTDGASGLYRIFVLFGSTAPGEDVLRILGFRDVDVGGSGSADDEVKGINPGSVEQIKFYVGAGAGCYDGATFILDCVVGTVMDGAATLLTNGGEAVFIADAGTLPSGEAVSLKLEKLTGSQCIGFDPGTGFVPIDLAQYPECYKITTFPADAGFVLPQTFGICLEHSGLMIDETTQIDRVRLHRMADDQSIVQVMSLVRDVIDPCPAAEYGSTGNPFTNFARAALEKLGLPIAPPPLVANALTIRHEGLGGRGEASTLGFAMPSRIEGLTGTYDPAKDWYDLGIVPLSTPLDVTAIVLDEGDDPVMRSYVTFVPEAGTSLPDYASGVTPRLETAGPGTTAGTASVRWQLDQAGERFLRAQGYGYSYPIISGDHPDSNGIETLLKTPFDPFQVTFRAFACDAGAIDVEFDGALSESAWSTAADAFPFEANLSKGSSTDAVLLVMNDCSDLWIGMEVVIDTEQEHQLTLNFDNDNSYNASGTGDAEVNDDILVLGSGMLIDRHLTQSCLNRKQSDCGDDDQTHGGGLFTNAGACHILSGDRCLVYELSHPLESQDGVFDIDLAFGQKFGLSATLSIGKGAQGNTQWPGFRQYQEVQVRLPGGTP